jgi:hypothetical protein
MVGLLGHTLRGQPVADIVVLHCAEGA